MTTHGVRRVVRSRLCLALVIALATLLRAPAQAADPVDQVTVKGNVLSGKILRADSKGIDFETDYGKGTLTIPFEDIENIVSENQVQVLYGDDEEVVGRILSVREGQMLVGDDAATATRVDVATIHTAVGLSPEGVTWQDRMRSYWRYWDGNVDVGYSLQQARIDVNALSLGFGLKRTKGPTRFSLNASYLYSTQEETATTTTVIPGGIRTRTGPETTTIQDHALGIIRFEYDITDRLYAFASGDAEYDAVQRLSIRGIPKAGLGYFFYRSEDATNYFSGEVGPGWVYEKFFGGMDNNFVTIAFGLRAGFDLWYGSRFQWAMDYLPAVDDWANDYLIRNDASLLIPLVDPLGFKLTLLNIYDSMPAPDTDKNSLYFTVGFSVAF